MIDTSKFSLEAQSKLIINISESMVSSKTFDILDEKIINQKFSFVEKTKSISDKIFNLRDFVLEYKEFEDDPLTYFVISFGKQIYKIKPSFTLSLLDGVVNEIDVFVNEKNRTIKVTLLSPLGVDILEKIRSGIRILDEKRGINRT